MSKPSPQIIRLLRPRDQAPIAVMLACALVMIWGYWRLHGGHRGELIEIDRAAPLQARYQVNVNGAEWPELAQLPGIGHILAQRLVLERQTNGPFESLDDVRRVRGIGQRTLERIRPFLIPIARDTDWVRQLPTAEVDPNSEGA